MRRTLVLLWAGPNSLLGLILGSAALLTGGRAQLRRGVLEFYGGATGRWLAAMLGGGFLAMTLGHTIIGCTPAGLDVARNHEHVHVRQYERWGPLFLPAYLVAMVVAWLRGQRPYRDNYFEREAYASEPCR